MAADQARLAHWYQLGEAAGAGLHRLSSLYHDGAAPPVADVAADDPFAVISTAAVDVIPRGAVLTHANVLTANLTVMRCLGYTPADRYLLALPLFHITALGNCAGPHARRRRQRAGVALSTPRRRCG